jgi:hypothetical protein
MQNDLIAASRQFLGVKFQHQGRSLRGLDCCGLVVMSYRAIGVTVRDSSEYSHWMVKNELLNWVLESHVEVSLPEPGCLALFHLSKTNQQHVGIISAVDPLYVIHAYAPCRRVVEHRLPYPEENDIYINQKNLLGYFKLCSL